MSGDIWEGWEASEEREDEERRTLPQQVYSRMEKDMSGLPEGVEGIVWIDRSTPPENGLDEVSGGTVITTPSGRRVIVGIHPDVERTPEEMREIGEAADRTIDEAEKQQEYVAAVQSWMSSLVGIVGKAMSGEDPHTLWKVASMLYEYQQAVAHVQEKGYGPQEWTLKRILELIPNASDLVETEYLDGDTEHD